jgi:hypothetical protein
MSVVVLKPLRGKLKLKNVNENVTLRVSAEIVVAKGKFTQDVNFWCDVSGSNFKGYFGCDDMDFELGCNHLDGVRIDNLSKFTQSLRESGLDGVAKTFEIERDEIRMLCYQSMNRMPDVIAFFGEETKCFDALTPDEKNFLKVNDVINRFDTADTWSKKQFGIPFDETEQTAPSLEQLIEYRDKLVKP